MHIYLYVRRIRHPRPRPVARQEIFGPHSFFLILGDPGADNGGKGKSKRAGKYGPKKSQERRQEPLGDNVLPDQFQTVTAVLASDWCQKTFMFFCPIRSQNGGDRLELAS